MNKSPDRGSFRKQGIMRKVEEGTQTIEDAQGIIDLYKSWDEHRAELEATDEWKINNMEYDLRSAQWICDKAKQSEAYAQNIYAAICNNDFAKNEVWPLLQGKTWSASWRSAGGIVADMIEEGDYMDWYCSGIRAEIQDEEFQAMTKESQERYTYINTKFVGESVVTDEIRADLLKLGWIVIDNEEDMSI